MTRIKSRYDVENNKVENGFKSIRFMEKKSKTEDQKE